MKWHYADGFVLDIEENENGDLQSASVVATLNEGPRWTAAQVEAHGKLLAAAPELLRLTHEVVLKQHLFKRAEEDSKKRLRELVRELGGLL